MLDRRALLLSGAAAAAAGSTLARAADKVALHARPSPTALALDRLFDAFIDEGLNLSPEGVTTLGLGAGDGRTGSSRLNMICTSQ